MYCEWYVQEEIKGCGDILLFVLPTWKRTCMLREGQLFVISL